MTPAEHALNYAARGWRVVPIPAGEKFPKGMGDWQQRATTDPTVIAQWWPDGTTNGIGIATGDGTGMFVLDVDPDHGGDDTLADLQHEHGDLPDTLEVLTGGGGRHLYFAIPDGVTITNDQGTRLGPGLDIRGNGGQAVAPPTIHPNGTPYTWEASSDPTDGITAAPPPAWLITLLTVDNNPARPRRDTPRNTSLMPDRPGDRFETETQWADLLERDGWTLHSPRRGRGGDYELWTRPGKDPREGASASLYYEGSDVLKVFSSSIPALDPGATYTRFGYLAATRHGGDHRRAAQELGRQYAQEAPVTSTTAPGDDPAPAAPQRPQIVHNGRQLDHIVAEAIDALHRGNQPPTHFVRAGQLARLRDDEDGRPVIEALRTEHAKLALADSATWWRSMKDGGLTATSPPTDVAMSVLARGSWPLPALAGVVELPVLRPDGTFHVEHGYDSATRLYHWHRGQPYPDIPTDPTPEEVAAAVAFVDEALCDFPWDTTADRANAWGLLLTPLVRPLVPQVPMALVDAPEPGTGKGLLTEVFAIITMGRAAAVMAWPTTEEEVEKKATAALMAGATMVIWDNVEGMVKSGTLAAVLTADTWQGRILGRSEMVMVPNRATWVATGNNIDVGGDLARRCYRIRLDARQAQPWKRSGFKHPALKQWVADNRHELLHALCTIVSAWNVAGRPAADALPSMGGYTGWVRVVGGILEHVGINGFLANLDAFHADADQEARQWEAFLTAWAEHYRETSVTTAEVVAHVHDLMTGASMRESLPEDLAGYVDAPNFAQRLGKALRRRTGRHYGNDGIHLVEMPRDRRQIAIWCVTNRSVRLFDEEGSGHATTESDGKARESKTLPRSADSVTRDDAEKRGSAGMNPLATREKKLSTGPHGKTQGPATRFVPATPALPRADIDDNGHDF